MPRAGKQPTEVSNTYLGPHREILPTTDLEQWLSMGNGWIGAVGNNTGGRQFCPPPRPFGNVWRHF